jgi:hypothetical protein
VRRAAALIVALAALAACRRGAPADPGRLASLRAEHERLHEALDARVAGDAVVQEALAGGAEGLILAVRPSVVEDVLREAARLYFDRMSVDLGALEAKADGRIEHDTFLGRIKVGDWRLEILIEELRVELRARTPHLEVAGPNEVDLRVPVAAQEGHGKLALRFSWDSASVANLVCRDFDLVRELEGRTLPQEHTISGTLRLSAGPESVKVEPTLEEDAIRLKVDLEEASWAAVREALETQDSFSRCGMLLDPEKVLERLRALAAEGIRVKLPGVMFRRFSFPGAFEHTARIEGNPVAVGVRTRALQVTPRAMWSRASIDVDSKRPPRSVRGSSKAQSAVLHWTHEDELPEGDRCPRRSRVGILGAEADAGGR